jgi:hypothetical protein
VKTPVFERQLLQVIHWFVRFLKKINMTLACFFHSYLIITLEQGFPTWGTWGVGKGDANFCRFKGKNDFWMFFWPNPEIFTNLNGNFTENMRTQPPKPKFSLSHNPSPPKDYLIRLSYTWGGGRRFNIFWFRGREKEKGWEPLP